MTDGLAEDLARLQAYAARLGSVIAAARDAAPEGATATDESGAVRAELGRDGRPLRFTVDDGWQHHLEPAALGAACLDAYRRATREHLRAWGEALEEEGWPERTRRVDDRTGTGVTASTPAPTVREPRGLARLTEDVLGELDRSRAVATPAPAPAPATPVDGVSVTLRGETLVDVSIQAEWAHDRSGSTLSSALGAALGAALDRARPQASPSDPAPSRPDLDELLAEALALLRATGGGS